MKIIYDKCAFEISWVAIDKDIGHRVYFETHDGVYYIDFTTTGEAEYAFRSMFVDEYYEVASYRKIVRCYDDVCLSDFLE
jgi:hypothetical protein